MISFYLFALGCFLGLAAVFVHPKKIFEYPYFMTATFTAFILPQAYGMFVHWEKFDESALENLFLMCFLCLAACFAGYYIRPRPRKIRFLGVPVGLQRTFRAGVVFVVVGYAVNYLMWQLPEEELQVTQWTGTVTKLHFFTLLVYPGFAICLRCALMQGRAYQWVITLIAAWNPLQNTIYGGRREQTALLFFCIAAGIFFAKGKVVSRWIVIGAICGAAILIPSTGKYRQLAYGGPINALQQIPLLENFWAALLPEKPGELKNGMVMIASTGRRGDYQMGAGYWNLMVHRFVPAQFVGRNLKDSIMIGGALEDGLEFARRESNLIVTPGSLVTGVADSFRQFGFLGAGFFFFLGMWFRRFWVTALHGNAIVAQVFYIMAMVSSMRAVTHQTVDFLPGLCYSLMFLWTVILYARLPVARNQLMILAPRTAA